MKNKIKFALMVFVAALAFAACAPQEFDEYSLGDSYTIGQDQFTFEINPASGGDEWTYNYTATFSADPVKYPYTYEIKFGDGEVSKNASGSHEYRVYAGTYTAQCIVYTPNGEAVTKEKTITFANDNPKVYQDDPASIQFALTGGKDNLAGKDWTLKAGSGLGPGDGTWGEWWNLNNEPALFDDSFIFKPNSILPNGEFVYENNGATFMNESLAGLFSDGDPTGSFITVEYAPATNATWNTEVRNGKNWLVLTKGFIGYAVAPGDLEKSEYEVLSFSPAEIVLEYHASDGNGWFFILTSETPVNPLTGEGSKTWVIDGNNKHTAEVNEALPDANIKGFMGLGPVGGYQEWWGAGAGEKSFETSGWTLEATKYTFTNAGKLTIETQGEGYGRKSCAASVGGYSVTGESGDDVYFTYDGGEYNYTLSDATLTIPANGFLAYYVGTQEYEVLYLSDTALCVRAVNTVEEQEWVFIFTPEGEQ
jgi:hypothetical protein